MEYVDEYDAEGNLIPYRYSSFIRAMKDKESEEKRKERQANDAERERRWAEEERLRKIQEAIPKVTAKTIADIARKEKKWFHDPKDNIWWTPEEYVETFERVVKGEEARIKRIRMKNPMDVIPRAFEVLRGDIEFADKKVTLGKLKRLEEFVMRVVRYYRKDAVDGISRKS